MLKKLYKVREIFNILGTNGIFHAVNVNVLDKQKPGSHPYVVRTSQSNGIRGYLIEDETKLNPGGTISFAQDTAQIFYQSEPYFTGNKIKVFQLKNHELTESIALYLISCLNKSFSIFQWGQSFNSNVLADVKISLPATPDGNPDWEYMQEYIAKLEQERIAELEQERIAELEQYLVATGLSDYTLTDEDIQTLSLSLASGVTKGQIARLLLEFVKK